MPASCASGGSSDASIRSKASSSSRQFSRKTVSQHLFLGGEVVVEQTVGDPGLLGDVADAARVVALLGEHADGRVEDDATLVGGRSRGIG